jgi:hypothetical protein
MWPKPSYDSLRMRSGGRLGPSGRRGCRLGGWRWTRPAGALWIAAQPEGTSCGQPEAGTPEAGECAR